MATPKFGKASRLFGSALAGATKEPKVPKAPPKKPPPPQAKDAKAPSSHPTTAAPGGAAASGGAVRGRGAAKRFERDAFDAPEPVMSRGPGGPVRGRGKMTRRFSPYDRAEEDFAEDIPGSGQGYDGYSRWDYDPNEPRWTHDQFQGPQTTGSSIFVRNLPAGVAAKQLGDLFSTVGQVASIQVEGGPLPTATIGYVRQDVAPQAVREYHGRSLMGHVLKVSAVSNSGNSADPGDEDFWRQELREMSRQGRLQSGYVPDGSERFVRGDRGAPLGRMRALSFDEEGPLHDPGVGRMRSATFEARTKQVSIFDRMW